MFQTIHNIVMLGEPHQNMIFYTDDDDDDDDDIFIMIKCMFVTKNEHFPLPS